MALSKTKPVLVSAQSNGLGNLTDESQLSGAYAGYGAEVPNVYTAAQLQCNIDDGAAKCAYELGWHLVKPRHLAAITDFGPELGIARSIPNHLSHSPSAGRIIRCATGSSDLTNDWHPTNATGRVLFSRMVSFVPIVMAGLGDYEIATNIFIQGEGDAQILSEANDYESNFQDYCDAIWANFGTQVNIVTPLLHPDSTMTHTTTVNDAKLAVAAANERVYTVSTSSLAISGDGVHYDSNNVCALGVLLGTFADSLIAPCG